MNRSITVIFLHFIRLLFTPEPSDLKNKFIALRAIRSYRMLQLAVAYDIDYSTEQSKLTNFSAVEMLMPRAATSEQAQPKDTKLKR